MRRFGRTGFLTALALTLATRAIPVHAQCSPEKTLEEMSHKQGTFRRYQGRYQNGAYGYETVIPGGWTGLDAKNPLYQRGFTIPLLAAKGILIVSAAPNSLEYPNVRAAAEGSLEMFRKHATTIEPPVFESLTMGGEPAETVRVRFTCPPSATGYLCRETTGIANGYLYSVTWQGLAGSFDRTTQELLRQILFHWHYSKPR